ncbi:MAG: helix-turn-helix transcriptional regulator [Clostridia bacterium]|nr:helix-turn-helix transcriptional regulator [Clostridia bacterium]
MQTKNQTALYKKELFEVHKWSNPLLPFIFHTDLVDTHAVCGNWHESLEILQIIEGSGRILCDSVDHNISVGDIIIINSNEVHRITSDSEIRFHCFIVGADFCIQNGLDIKKLKFKTKIKDEKAAELLALTIEEIKAAKSQMPFSLPAVRSFALSLLVYLSRRYSQSIDNTKENRQSDIIKRGLEYINENFCDALTLEDIAQKASISKYHFLREFKLYTGYTVVSYINTLRCEYAKRLLGSSLYSVSEIAVMCGYENLSYFSKTFKMYTGCLPSKYNSKRSEAT